MDTTNEQELRRRLIQLIAEVAMQLEHALLMDLADYAVAICASSRATVFLS